MTRTLSGLFRIKMSEATMIDQIASIFRTSEANAKVRILKLKIGPTCGRCGGSGHYSYNPINGTKCFGCNGHGVTLPKTNAEWFLVKEAAIGAVNDGRHQAYVERLAAQRRCKKGWDRAMDAWKRLEALNGYGKAWRLNDYVNKVYAPGWEEINERNQIGLSLCNDLKALDKGKDTDWIAYEKRLTKGLSDIEAAIEALQSEAAQKEGHTP